MSDSLFKSFTQSKCPSWRCPDCFNETLTIVPESFFKANSGETSRCKNEEWFCADHVRLVFSCVLLCQRTDCGATVAVTGKGWTEEDNYYDENNQVQTNYPDWFRAKTFYPALPLFLPPEGCPESVLDHLASVSSLLTGHPTAAANAIRSLLEVLLDDLGVPRVVLNKGAKPHFLSLHRRIQEYPQLLGSHHDAFMALKHFGNAGSHGGEPINQSHLEDACEVLELIITLLYQKHPDVSDHIARLDKAFSKK
ncbi:DUF4145 domain-containing protein [Pantoea agglomerans]|uniref:DUF4145 domain-containing protein n=1 Tax=Enterobacter agglomerans TaxID=549 RepID=A0AAN2FIK9_ENTAG|nr:DUF4145 domain-containing protein [Pantoea agglomerans]CAH6385529.1 DUF4145 domain-containing protein [Pantoea agglomerans]